MNEVNQVNEHNQMDEAKRMNETNRTNETNRSNESNRMKDSSWTNEINRLNEINRRKETSWTNEANQRDEANPENEVNLENEANLIDEDHLMDVTEQMDELNQVGEASQMDQTVAIKILVAEDEPDIRDLVAFTLRFAGYEVISGSNGEEAVELAKREFPDLIILDVRMPRMTGYDACKLIKAEPNLKDVPVIFLSAKGQEAEIQNGMDAGAEDYLLKPFAPDQLTDRVRSILAKFGK